MTPQFNQTVCTESCFRYTVKLFGGNVFIADWLLRLSQTYKRWGIGLCYLYLCNVNKFAQNQKLVHHTYRHLELNLRIKPLLRLKREKSDVLGTKAAINQVQSMDFIQLVFWCDLLTDERQLRTANVIDDCSREAQGIDVDLSLPNKRVIRSLELFIEWRGRPSVIRSDSGPEYVAQKLVDWSDENQIILIYIQLGKPRQNAYLERFNRTARHE